MTREESALPPLAPSKVGLRLISSVERANPAHLRREVLLLLPRLQSVEASVASLRSQIPSNMDKLLLQLFRDVRRMSGKGADAPDPDDSAARLAEVESRLLLDIETTYRESWIALGHRLLSLGPAVSSEGVRRDGDEIQLRSAERKIETQFRRTRSRVASLESAISRLQMKAAADTTRDKLSALSADVSSNRQRLAMMQAQIEQIRFEAPAVAPAAVVRSSVDVTKPATPPRAVPDIRKAVARIEGDVAEFQTLFDRQIGDIQQKTELFERQMSGLAAIGVEVSAAARSFEGRVRDLDQNTQKIVSQMCDVARRMEDGSDQQLLTELAAKLQKIHDDLKTEIDAFSAKMEKLKASTIAPRR